MSRSHKFRPEDLYLPDNSYPPKHGDDYASETPLGSAVTLLPNRRSRQKAPKKRAFNSSGSLRLLSLILHSALVAIHVVLIIIWSKELEHRLVFRLERQKTVSFFVTAITQTFGTIYSALLVFVTQTLSMRRSLHREQSLTATHDIASAWAGIGSAVLHIWHQKAVPATFIGVLSVFFYLGNMLVLHITTPALFTLQAFNASRPLQIATTGLPAYNLTGLNLTSINHIPYTVLDNLTSYAQASLYYLPYVDGKSETIGLEGGTLYDVLEPSGGIDTVNSTATGFNITCGYWDQQRVEFIEGKYYAVRNFSRTGIETTQPNIISTIYDIPSLENSIVLYSTIPILDTNESAGPWFNVTPPMNTSVSAIQIFRCSQSLVKQTAVLDAKSRKAVALEPEFKKTSSTWLPYTDPDPIFATDNNYLNAWAGWYSVMPRSGFPYDPDADAWTYVTLADLFLIQKLNLHPTNPVDAPRSVKLHDLENALSELVASMFWTLGHVSPARNTVQGAHRSGGTFNASIGEIQSPISLLAGSATVAELFTQVRLDLSLVAVSVGLAASVALLLHSLFQTGAKDEENVAVGGTGMLHAIWLYRNHPELEGLLQQVDHPTDDDLRRAGMIRTRLVGGRKQEEF
ncbi:hypothetical protein C8R43DRAFT_228631 [Mycena crocata]|nr:hypothetical protein C8R43DRAFT_228631 [Mycena crocata]